MEKKELKEVEGHPPKAFFQAVDEFNGGRYYSCHDTLEELWSEEPGEVRKFYQGLLQISVALYHERNGNRRGAVRLMESGMTLLSPFLPRFFALALDEFLSECEQAMDFLKNKEKDRLPRELHPRLQWAANS